MEVPTFVIGTGELADLRLRDPAVSREHLLLSLGEDGLVLRDRTSRNGTWVGGLRIREVALAGDVRLRLGTTTTLVLKADSEVSSVRAYGGGSFGSALGRSPAMRVVFDVLDRASATDLTVLLEGESGVGKEVLARSIHHASKRRSAPFVTVDCGAIPSHLLESELFGHIRGAFTGATTDRTGLFVEANGGTLFLDEGGELPLELQPKLLRVLEQREVRPVGTNKHRPVDVRILAATNRRLASLVAEGGFREDLLYRLSVVKVTVPPLRARPEDVNVLARAFLHEATKDPGAQLPPDVEGMLGSYDWPGNVRELRNVIQRYVALGVRDRASLLVTDDGHDAPQKLAKELGDLPFNEAKQQVVEKFERAYVEEVLARENGVVVKAAERSGIARASFYRMLERLQIKHR